MKNLAVDPGPVVLFDLDGTLTDPFEGITRSIRYALQELGRTPPPPAELSWCIGPPLLRSFMSLLNPESGAVNGDTPDPVVADTAVEKEAWEAVRLYRQRFAEVGMLENQVYEGIPDVLESLSASGWRLFLATSKPRIYAQPILKHFGLATWFQGIYGSELDGTHSNKADLLGHILQKESLSPEQAIMVGDRKHDIEGARRTGLRVLAVSYGYAAPGELAIAGPDAIADSPREIPARLGSLEGRAVSPLLE